ncbi:hypothetical protein [Gloeobacter violaceus]|uniref:Glr3422 protein n=1 Tax=Gloeobacter violaceus (strain ATCC 29082 / PCC 7421) TaxID=251221 RepID=Q7NFV2_GLOVI|nr:hypothetical protein [Gloeobacter violaceus]BAC91363.1 glr3422 [Gloeobacter violaceus PCC 7421]
MKTGTLPWLLGCELRLWWREITTKPTAKTIFAVLGLSVAALLVWLWFVFAEVRGGLSVEGAIPEPALWIAVVLWLFGFFYAFYQAIEQSIVALFDRGDLDLLVSSPISTKVIFASRLLGVAVEIFLSFCVVVVPAGALAVLAGVPRLLGVFPALIGMVLAATSLAMLVTLGLVRLLGARRARTAAQVVSALLAAVFFVASQLPNWLAGSGPGAGVVWEGWRVLFAEGGPLGAQSWLWTPARAVFADPVAMLWTLGGGGALGWLATELLYRAFIAGTQQSVTESPKRRYSGEPRWHGGLGRAVLLKEWRLILRNPYLLSQTFLQVVFLIPGMVVLLQNGGGPLGGAGTLVATAATVVGSSLVYTLTRIGVSGEEAPDLLRSCPTERTKLVRLKLLAALIPVWVLLLPLFGILLVRREPWLVPLGVFLAATVAAATLRLWNSRPIALAEMFKSRAAGGGDPMLGILEFVSLLGWGGVSLLAARDDWAATLLTLDALGLLMAAGYWRSRRLGSSLGF